MAIAGVVDQHVNETDSPLRVSDGSGNCRVVGHVQHERVRAIASEGGKRIGIAVPPHGADHTMPRVKRALRERTFQARADARD